MKFWFVYALVLATLLSCAGEEGDPGETVPPVETVLKKEDVMTNLSRNPYQIAEWYSVRGKDTTFVNQDPYYDALMKHVFLIFHDDKWVSYYPGDPIPNTVFLGKAEIFDLNIFFFRPIDFVYGWDENEGTMALTWANRTADLKFFPKNATLKLDKNGYRRLRSFEEAKATRTTGVMRFHYQDDGKDYTVILKQMWSYAEGSTPRRTRYVVF